VCRRPLFHDEFLPAIERSNVTVVDCPGGLDRITERGAVVDGREYELDCIVYATGFEPEVTPLSRRAGHEVLGRNGLPLGEKWENGSHSLFGMMTRGFPNLFIMPAPGQQAVTTVNFTLVTVVGAEHIAETVRQLEALDAAVFEVSEAAEADWCERILSSHVDGSSVMDSCTPSFRTENRYVGNPLSGSFGGAGLGDYFAFCDLLREWRERGDLDGLEIDRRHAADRDMTTVAGEGT
jgi:cyclohexanone monooxygenase/pentalenolactone D synthase